MKTIRKSSLFIFAFVLLASVIYSGCSKERIDTRSLNKYNSPNTYLDSKKESEQEFTITADSGGPIIGNQGTKLYGSRQCLQFPNGDTVALPYTIKLVELYGAKQMIYYQMPTVAGGTILKTDGEIRYRAFKNNTELISLIDDLNLIDRDMQMIANLMIDCSGDSFSIETVNMIGEFLNERLYSRKNLIKAKFETLTQSEGV